MDLADMTMVSHPPDGSLRVLQHRDAHGIVVELDGELDLSTVPELEQHLAEIGAQAPDRLLIDLRRLRFMDSTGLAVLIAAQRAADTNGHRLHLHPGSVQVQRLFALAGILDRFTFES